VRAGGALPFARVGGRAADDENPFKRAKVGDYAKYNAVVKTDSTERKSVRTQTVTAADAKELTLKTVTEADGKELPSKRPEMTIDLTKPYEPVGVSDGPASAASLKWARQTSGTEKLKVGGKEYACTWTAYKPADAKVHGDLKVWTSKEIPFVVKRTLTLSLGAIEVKYATELFEFGGKK
jgi:hypothetical protein